MAFCNLDTKYWIMDILFRQWGRESVIKWKFNHIQNIHPRTLLIMFFLMYRIHVSFKSLQIWYYSLFDVRTFVKHALTVDKTLLFSLPKFYYYWKTIVVVIILLYSSLHWQYQRNLCLRFFFFSQPLWRKNSHSLFIKCVITCTELLTAIQY